MSIPGRNSYNYLSDFNSTCLHWKSRTQKLGRNSYNYLSDFNTIQWWKFCSALIIVAILTITFLISTDLLLMDNSGTIMESQFLQLPFWFQLVGRRGEPINKEVKSRNSYNYLSDFNCCRKESSLCGPCVAILTITFLISTHLSVA